MKKIDVKKSDYNRILLTDTLPYEVPVIFSNEGFYFFWKNDADSINPILKDIFDGNTSKSFIPFEFRIKKGDFGFRTLSIIHPAIQLSIANLYREFDFSILHLCSKSNYSLRHPSAIASYFYEKNYAKETETKEDTVEQSFEAFDKQCKHASSYFTYKKYSLLHKFYDSYEFHRLEKRYKSMFRLDIAKCFSSVYTHSISWAAKNKKHAKGNSKCYSFEKEFDSLMMRGNYNETNGIVIGPEFSRIFAEIILQRIDHDCEKNLTKINLFHDSDYSIRRYIDDYFIFFNDDKIFRKVLKELQFHQEHYKFHINEQKSILSDRPFITGITSAKITIKDFFKDMFLSSMKFTFTANKKPDNPTEEVRFQTKLSTYIQHTPGLSNLLISKYKSLVQLHNIAHQDISSFSLSILKNKMFRTLEQLKLAEISSDDYHDIYKFLEICLDVIFFIYMMDPKSRPTYILSQIILIINDFTNILPNETGEPLRKKIFDEALFSIKALSATDEFSGIEILNLLIAIDNLGGDFLLTESDLKTAMQLHEFSDAEFHKSNFNYFQIITLIYYTIDKPKFNHVFQSLESYIISIFKDEEYPMIRADLTCLFFDILSCKKISSTTKQVLAKYVLHSLGRECTVTASNNLINCISKNGWFANWDKSISLFHALNKKELRSPY